MIFRLAATYDELMAMQANNIILCSLARPLPEWLAFASVVAFAATLAMVPWLLHRERRLRQAHPSSWRLAFRAAA